MIVQDVLYIHDIHDAGMVIGPVSGDLLTRRGLKRLGMVEPPIQEEIVSDSARAQLAQFQPREDRVTFFDILRLVFRPRKGKHS